MKYLTPMFGADLMALPWSHEYYVKALYNHRVSLEQLYSFGNIDVRTFSAPISAPIEALFYGIFDTRFVRLVGPRATRFSRYCFSRMVCECRLLSDIPWTVQYNPDIRCVKISCVLPTANILLCDIL